MAAPVQGNWVNRTYNDEARIHQEAQQNLDQAIATTLNSAQRINTDIVNLKYSGTGTFQKSLVPKEFDCLEYQNVFLHYRKNSELKVVNIGTIIAGNGTGASGNVFSKTKDELVTSLNALLFQQLAKGL